MKLIISLTFFVLYLQAFDLVKFDNNISKPTLLIIGGIHGNEPGGYEAANLIATRYNIKSANVWVIPNLNIKSIQHNVRGFYGDMNRKFAHIKEDDEDYEIVKRVKSIILNPRVSLVLNLHDGHGFYRSDYQNLIFNPNSWGQTCVIDQESLDVNSSFKKLNDIALRVNDITNEKLLQDHHLFHVRNTKTALEDLEMQNSLTYFSIKNSKPAFAIETSKNLKTTSQKVYYQLRAIEAFMQIMSIDFKRDFKLNVEDIYNQINKESYLKINNAIYINLNNIRPKLKYIPLKLKNNKFKFNSYLGSYEKKNGYFQLYLANKKLSKLYPERFKYIKCNSKIRILSEKFDKIVTFASEIIIKDDFKVISDDSLRVNVIGYRNRNGSDDSSVKILKREIQQNYSIDTEKKLYRVEVYNGDSFCGMISVKFK